MEEDEKKSDWDDYEPDEDKLDPFSDYRQHERDMVADVKKTN
jgi:hypothetical protein